MVVKFKDILINELFRFQGVDWTKFDATTAIADGYSASNGFEKDEIVWKYEYN